GKLAPGFIDHAEQTAIEGFRDEALDDVLLVPHLAIVASVHRRPWGCLRHGAPPRLKGRECKNDGIRARDRVEFEQTQGTATGPRRPVVDRIRGARGDHRMTFLRYFLYVLGAAILASVIGGVFASIIAVISPEFVRTLFSPPEGTSLTRYAAAVGAIWGVFI